MRTRGLFASDNGDESCVSNQETTHVQGTNSGFLGRSTNSGFLGRSTNSGFLVHVRVHCYGSHDINDVQRDLVVTRVCG